jgi:hypothetical protein
MVEELASLLENFPGAANQTRCFLHILNLTAKSILQQFEIPKKKRADDGNGPISNATRELLALSAEIENEPGIGDLDDGVDEDDSLGNEEGLEDEREELSAEEIAELEADLIPVRLMLTKV